MSKRLAVAIANKLLTASITVYALTLAKGDPTAVAAICSTCVVAMVGAAWSYQASETRRPSGPLAATPSDDREDWPPTLDVPPVSDR